MEAVKPDSETQKLESLPSDDLNAAASDVGAAIENNAAASEKVADAPKPQPVNEGWKGQPIKNFKTDAKGNIVMKNGQPVKRGGRPSKPKAGDRLAGGGVYGVEQAPGPGNEPAQPAGRVVLPGQPMDGQPMPEQGNAVEAGPEAGRVVTKLGFNLATKKGGEKWRPDDDEREFIEKAASASLNGRRFPWPLALLFGVAVYVLSRVEFAKKKKEKEHVDNAPVHHGADAERQDVISPPVSPLGGW